MNHPALIRSASVLSAMAILIMTGGATGPQDRPGGNGPLPGDPGYDGPVGQSGGDQPSGYWVSKSGAVATDGDRGILGDVMNVASEQEAGAAAMALCRQRGGDPCKLQVTFSNQCVALVTGATRFSVQLGPTEAEAAQVGMRLCERENETNCHVYYTACALPVFASN